MNAETLFFGTLSIILGIGAIIFGIALAVLIHTTFKLLNELI